MTLTSLLSLLSQSPETVSFDDVINVISDNYHYTATNFTNGTLENKAGTNEGSCKIFAFAQINKLTKEQTLACFGHYYREDVLKHPQGSDHGNIRNFILSGWDEVKFDNRALVQK
jgi:hypothetical protein